MAWKVFRPHVEIQTLRNEVSSSKVDHFHNALDYALKRLGKSELLHEKEAQYEAL